MKYSSNVLMTIEQPATKIPMLIDYDAMPVYPPQRVSIQKGSNPSRRLVANARLNTLPAKPGRVITDHTFKFESYSPWDAKFPATPSLKPVSKGAKYDKNMINRPLFRKIIDRPAPKLDDFEDPRDLSFSPFDDHFPKAPQEKRKSRNRSQRRRRHMLAAMATYKSEHGHMDMRPVVIEEKNGKFKSFSPWQEESFAKACGIPLHKFIKGRNMPEMRPFSFSPWSDKFPVFKPIPQKVSLPKTTAKMPPPPTATPFPAFSPLHKRAKPAHRNSVTPSTSAMDLVEEYEMLAGLI